MRTLRDSVPQQPGSLSLLPTRTATTQIVCADTKEPPPLTGWGPFLVLRLLDNRHRKKRATHGYDYPAQPGMLIRGVDRAFRLLSDTLSDLR